MQITTVHYERRRSDKAYGYRMVALTAALDEGEEPMVMLGVLRDIAHQQLDADERAEEEGRRRKAAEDEERYRREHEEYRTRVRQEREATSAFSDDDAGPWPEAIEEIDDDAINDDDDDNK